MIFEYLPLEQAEKAEGVVVAVDVLRAFTTAAYAFAAGTPSITMACEVEEALALRRMNLGSRVMGEVGGQRVPQFDYSNSPSELAGASLSDVPLIQRTSAGTQGLVRAERATILMAASLVVASSTAAYVRRLGTYKVTFIITGWGHGELGDEDLACAEFIGVLANGGNPDQRQVIERVQRSPAAQRMLEPGQKIYPPGDLALCLGVDHFSFAMRAHRRDGRITLARFERWGTGALRRWNI